MVTAPHRRRAVTWLRTDRHVSERRARRVAGISASSYRGASRRYERDQRLRRRLRSLAEQRPRWGSARLHWLLTREGLVINHKLYGATLPRRATRSRAASEEARQYPRVTPPTPTCPTERWSMDFVPGHVRRWAAIPGLHRGR